MKSGKSWRTGGMLLALLVALALVAVLGGRAHRAGRRPRLEITIAGQYSNEVFDGTEGEMTNAFDGYFVARICGEQWQIDVSRSRDVFDGTEDYPGKTGFATNQWERIAFDGTNTYYTTTYRDHFNVAMTGPHDLYTGICAAAGLNGGGASRLGLYIPWVAYGLMPQRIGRIPGHTIPLPWFDPRFSLRAFGYRWELQGPGESGFVTGVRVVRDRKLDRATADEFLRPEHAYPATPEARDADGQNLQIRRSIPDGLAVAEYVCTGRVVTNGVSVPSEGVLTRYALADGTTNRAAVFRSEIHAEKVTVGPFARLGFAAPAGADVRVLDYRYRPADPKAARNFAEYIITDGSAYKGTNEPELWRQVNGE